MLKDVFLYPQIKLIQNQCILLDERKIYELEQKELQQDKDQRKNNQNMRLPGFDSTDQEDDQVIEEDDDIVMNT